MSDPVRVPAVLLLRKSRPGNPAVVLKERDFPLRIVHEGRNYVVERTRGGGLLMKAEKG